MRRGRFQGVVMSESDDALSRFDRLFVAAGDEGVLRIGEGRLWRWATLLDDDDVDLIVEMLREAK